MIRFAMAFILMLGLTVAASAADREEAETSRASVDTTDMDGAVEVHVPAALEQSADEQPTVRRWSPSPAAGAGAGPTLTHFPVIPPPMGLPQL
jgi:hypothetical protein